MAFDKQINNALLGNLKLKAKVLAILFGIIFIVQIIFLSYLYFKTSFFTGSIPIKVALFGPFMLLCGFLTELYSIRYFTQLLKSEKEISGRFAYVITFIEISFPSLLILFAGLILQQTGVISALQLLNSPPAFMYFLMILLSSLLLNFRLSLFAGIIAALEFIFLSLYLLSKDPQHIQVDVINNIIKAVFMLICGIIAGLVSKKIKEAVLSSLQSKNDLINKLDLLVKEKTSEIVLQKEDIEQKNKDITDSINYARRIQHSILPKTELVNSLFEHCFILYLPKDIVSGDFYWASLKNNKKIIAAVDCTGHGVPGAFMSMVGSSLLNEIVNEKQITESAAILNLLRERLIKTLQQTGNEGENRDGMDIALCVFDQDKIVFSGANNPLLLVRNKELAEFKSDKQPIGIHSGIQHPFTSQTIDLQKGDSIYIFTDGYIDQFGGPHEKKFRLRQLKETLLSIADKPMNEQKEFLHKCFNEWKGKHEQVDDVLLIGINVS